MGYIRHHGIAITGWKDEHIKQAHKVALKVFGDNVTEILSEQTNGYKSFFIGPDGSKEGWDESDSNDEKRAIFITWVSNSKLYVKYCEFFYGDDEGQSEVVSHN